MTKEDYTNVACRVVQQREFHAVCWQFESALRQGHSPRIEDFLNDADEKFDSNENRAEARQKLLAELLSIELEWRCQNGLVDLRSDEHEWTTQHHQTTLQERASRDRFPELSVYLQRFPFEKELVEELWGQLQNEHLNRFQKPVSLDLEHDRYDFIEEIDRGGSGAVWRVYDRKMHREAAVKFLFDPHVGTPMRLRLQREARLCGRLQHPGIVPVYELDQFADGRPLVAMKLIQGRTLASILEDEESSAKRHHKLNDWLKLFRHLCEAVAHAHDQGVIHRDLKPANVMVGSFDEVQVMDWGLGKELNGPRVSRHHVDETWVEDPASFDSRTTFQDDETLLGSVMGTPLHMPPEQAEGDIDRVDQRSDVFSLGSILCTILTGAPAFADAPDKAAPALTREQRLHAAKKRIGKAKAPRAIRRLAINCLQTDPENRPVDAGAVLDCLNRIESRRRRLRRTIAGTIGSVLIFVTLFELVTADHVTILPAPYVVSSTDEMVISTYDQLLADGSFEAAEQLLRQTQDDVIGPRVRLRLAELMRSQDRLAESEQVLRRLMRDFPKYDKAFCLLADVLRADERPDEALEVLQDALLKLPNSEALQAKKNELQSGR